MDELPFIDEHAVALPASRDRTWNALVRVVHGTLRDGGRVAGLRGCEPRRGSPRFDGGVGQTLPGFRVVEAEPGRRLALRGRHRFSRYQLTFLLDDDRLRAQTHAAFPGARGRLYRAAVIGSGGHRLVTRRLLRQVAARAAR